MKTLITTWVAATAALVFPGSVPAHVGHEAHVHATGGSVEQLVHWAAGIFHWSPVSLVVLVAALGVVVCTTLARIRVRGSHD